MKMTKKILALTLAVATVVSSAVAPVQKAEAAKSKNVQFGVFFAANSNCTWLANQDGSGGATKTLKTVKVVKGKKTNVSFTIKAKGTKVTQAMVFCIDAKGILSTFKNCKYSNIVVKCDGKKVSGVKTKQGYFEPKQKNNNYRLSFFNTYGSDGDTTKTNGTAKKYKFKKQMTVSFTFVAK